MRALIPILLLSIGCASMLRRAKHDVNIYGPEDLRAFEGANPLELSREDAEDGQVKYSAKVDRHATSLTLQSQNTRVEVPLTTHLAVGWFVLDMVCFWSIPFDAKSGSWRSFNDVKSISFGSASRPGAAAPPAGTAEDDRRREEERRREDDRRREEDRRRSAQASAPPSPARRAVISHGKLAVLDF